MARRAHRPPPRRRAPACPASGAYLWFRIMIKRILLVLAVLGGFAAASLWGLHLYYRGQIFNPGNEPPALAEAAFPVETVTIRPTPDLALTGWWHAPEDGEATVLYLHGNSGNMGDYMPGVAPLVAAGYGVLIFDYRGYGGNPGRPTDEALLADALAALDWLDRRGVRPGGVAVYGYSLGTGVAVPLAARRDVGAVVLAAPFGSIAQMGYAQYPRWFVDAVLADRFDSLAAAPNVHEPVLIVHGTRDTTVPATLSEPLAAALPNAQRVVIDGAGHGWDLFEDGGTAHILDFLAATLAR
ncbi:hypothetical protein CCR85_01685 [Rhodothalassium salexigens]|nr:hypothetical protein [Rhodothalassium salexigens]MBK5920845.1 hypothetical protein [Rhodothalassium salexigens]